MFISFKTIRYKNFLAVGNSWIEIQLDKHEKTLICGENGAGKTTIIDALTFALFKKAFRNINKPLLVNSITQEQCEVEVEFEIGTVEYKVRRGIKPEIFEIYKNGKLINQTSVYDYQDVLEKQILKFNFKTFKQIIILGSKSFVPFMQLPALDRRIVIEELLDIQIFSQMAKITRNKLDVKRDLIRDLESAIKVLEEKIDLQLANLQTNADQYQGIIDTNLQTITNGQTIINQLEQENSDANMQIFHWQGLVGDQSALQTQLTKLQQLQFSIQQNHTKTKKNITFFENNDECPTCTQTITDAFKKSSIKEHSDKLTEFNMGLDQIQKHISSVINQLDANGKILTTIAQLQTNIQVNTQKINQQKAWQTQLEVENSNLQIKIFNLETNDTNLKILQDDLNLKRNALDIEKNLKRHLEYTASLLKDTGIKTNIIKQYLPKINACINHYLSLMDFNVNFSFNETFEESIMARHRDKFAYESFSEGQKLRIDFALLFAWRAVAKLKNSVDTNLLIMDEVIDGSLDNLGIQDFFTLISNMKDVNMFIISPRGDVLEDKFEHVIKFGLVNDFTEIV